MRKNDILERYTYARRERHNFRRLAPELLAQASPHLRRKIIMVFEDFCQMLQTIEGITDFEKICLIYQTIATVCQYDYAPKRSLKQTFLGALKYRTAVCEGFAELLGLLIFHCTKQCDVYEVIGVCHDSNEHHAWNIIRFNEGKLAGKAFHLDVTWDLDKKEVKVKEGEEKYKWFLRPSAEMDRDWARDEYPECSQKFCDTIYKNQERLDELCDYFRGVEKFLSQ